MNVSKVSVVIPAYNRRNLLGETLESVLSQSSPPFEVIVVDDGSQDGTAEFAESYGPPVRVIRQANQGAGAARNRGFVEAVGDVIHFMDSDDVCTRNSYSAQLAAMNSAGAAMVHGPWVKTTFCQRTLRIDPVVLQQCRLPATRPMHHWLLRGWVTVLQPCLLRRSLVEKLGPYRTDLKPSEDSEFLFRIGKSSAKIVHTPDTLLLYRVHPEGQVSVANQSNRAIDWARCLTAIAQQINEASDLDRGTRFHFDMSRVSASRAIHGQSSDVAEAVLEQVGYLPRIVEPVNRVVDRFVGKYRRMRFGGNYGASFQVGPMTPGQRQLITEMGYTFGSEQ